MKSRSLPERKKLLFSNFKLQNKDGSQYNPSAVKFLYNYYILPDGTLKRKPLFTKLINLPNAHSLFQVLPNLYLVCGDINSSHYLCLYNRDSNQITPLHPVVKHTQWYVSFDNKVYIVNKFWKNVFDIPSCSLIGWFVPEQVLLENVSEASDYVFTDVIEFPNCEHLSFFAGRFFGAVDNKLWFSEPIFPTFTKPYNFVEFPDTITAVCANDDLVVVGFPNGLSIIGVENNESFDLRIKTFTDFGIVSGGIVSYQDTFLLCCSDGFRLYIPQTNEFIKINIFNYNLKIRDIFGIGRLDDSKFLISTDLNLVDFQDEITVEVIKSNK